jgi:hypothetical protein
MGRSFRLLFHRRVRSRRRAGVGRRWLVGLAVALSFVGGQVAGQAQRLDNFGRIAAVLGPLGEQAKQPRFRPRNGSIAAALEVTDRRWSDRDQRSEIRASQPLLLAHKARVATQKRKAQRRSWLRGVEMSEHFGERGEVIDRLAQRMGPRRQLAQIFQ